jgi:uncharacterized membrane-anchored protein YhcB (DUF1043 family)
MEMNLGLIATGALILVLFGVLIGCTLSERWLETRAKRQAELQRSLNKQWQEIMVARQKSSATQRAEA